MRDYRAELANRINFIRETLQTAGADGVVFGNSGGKDSALVGVLCKRAADDVLGLIMPCETQRNYDEDRLHAEMLSEQFDIENIIIDLTAAKRALVQCIEDVCTLREDARNNINPRLRMSALYAVAQSKNYLVAGTGNASELFMGYFTKWGDGACDFNPIADLTASEVLDFLRFLDAPQPIIEKAPSAGLYEGQTDEGEMGVGYAEIDAYLLGIHTAHVPDIIMQAHARTEHKRKMPIVYKPPVR
ncbi:MAG: NAD(+) synthase [Christensenellales bacterium]